MAAAPDPDRPPDAHGTAQTHDVTVPYADEVVDITAALISSAWTSWPITAGRITDYYAKGPCPACHAIAQGKGTTRPGPIENQGIVEELLPDASRRRGANSTVDIPVTCMCGASHGVDGKTGCGRQWTLTLKLGE